MPIYEYVCAACGAESEVMHKVSEGPGKCPACGKAKLTKLMSATGFRLGGGGWYETDFKAGGKRNLAGDSGATVLRQIPDSDGVQQLLNHMIEEDADRRAQESAQYIRGEQGWDDGGSGHRTMTY